jgi:RimJ/RimL family protein N-acetyltransferase
MLQGVELLTINDPPALVPGQDLELEGAHVRLVPLRVEHGREFQAWVDAREPGMGFMLGSPYDFGNSAEAMFAWLINDVPQIAPFAVESKATGELLGYTRYLHIEPKRRMLHIGGTWYVPEVRGTVVNPECKYLLLQHAFEVAGYNRVQIQTSADNIRSQRAIARIGATFEGVSRADYLLRDGGVRSTWIAAVIRSEWPGVRQHLEELVNSAPGIS